MYVFCLSPSSNTWLNSRDKPAHVCVTHPFLQTWSLDYVLNFCLPFVTRVYKTNVMPSKRHAESAGHMLHISFGNTACLNVHACVAKNSIQSHETKFGWPNIQQTSWIREPNAEFSQVVRSQASSGSSDLISESAATSAYSSS